MEHKQEFVVLWKNDQDVIYQTATGTTHEISKAKIFKSLDDCERNAWRLAPAGYVREFMELKEKAA